MTAANENPTTTAIATRVEVPGLGLVVTVDPELLARRDDIASAVLALGPVDETNYEQHDELIGREAQHDRDVENDRVRFKSPYLQACRLIDARAVEAKVDPEDSRRRTIAVAAIKDGLRRKAEAAAAERERVAREAEAAAERERIIVEEKRRQLAELERGITEADRPVLEELKREAEYQADQAQAKIMHDAGDVWLNHAHVESSAPRRGGASTTMRPGLIIDDLDAIPRVVNGIECLVPNEQAISTLLKANVAVPGCRWAPKPVVTRGRR